MEKTRGAYAKGIAKRAAILEKALEAFAKSGYLATSMREIAAASDLTQAGLLHHFPNKESLLLAIIEQRDARTAEMVAELGDLPLIDRSLKMLERNQANRTETLVFSILAAEAEDVSHPAHEYMLNRYRAVRTNWARDVCELRGGTSVTEEDRTKASLIAAVWDGLQLQSLLEEDFDMREPLKYALEMIVGR